MGGCCSHSPARGGKALACNVHYKVYLNFNPGGPGGRHRTWMNGAGLYATTWLGGCVMTPRGWHKPSGSRPPTCLSRVATEPVERRASHGRGSGHTSAPQALPTA